LPGGQRCVGYMFLAVREVRHVFSFHVCIGHNCRVCYLCVGCDVEDHELESRSLEELCSSVKEPEELDHAAKCHLLHDDAVNDEATSATADDWMYVLGHDRLKKRVSHNTMCLLIHKSEVSVVISVSVSFSWLFSESTACVLYAVLSLSCFIGIRFQKSQFPILGKW